MADKRDGLRCPQCGTVVKAYRNPFPTADIIIEQRKGMVLILRRNEPRQWAIPGGYCDYGESLEQAAVREAREETGLRVELIEQFYTYSDPRRDPRQHTITTVYIARAIGGVLQAQDDAQEIGVFSEADLPARLAFDHDQILKDYFHYKKTGQRPTPGTAGAEGGTGAIRD
jgi:ADP-ribose pyrophosphatase YjhB (NUDIX family)